MICKLSASAKTTPMKSLFRFSFFPLLAVILLGNHSAALADVSTALLAMEDQQNPLLLVNTSQGEIYIELFPAETPENSANFLALAAGEVEILNSDSSSSSRPRYFNGMRFHRVIPGFVIQAGSPAYQPLGEPSEVLADEINADFLGLDQLSVLNPDGSVNETLNIGSQSDFEQQILIPLYGKMNISTASELLSRQYDVLSQLQSLTIKQAYENLGYRYNSNQSSRRVSRGVLALANSGPDSNGPEFFIALADADWLSGKHTVIGKVVEGLNVVDTIGVTAIDATAFSRLSTLIYSVRRAN